MPTGLRQATGEFYEGIAATGVVRIRISRARGRAAVLGGSGVTSFEAVQGATGVAASSVASEPTDRGLMATELGGRRTTGGPFGKRSGCAA